MTLRSIIVILGPTASGKSSLGVRLAKKFRGVVISADSRQVYRGLDIGTAKITKRQMRGVPHFLLDVASPRRQYSVAHYARDVGRVMKRILESTPIFLVGGSPFYIDAVTKPNSFSLVPPNPALRKKLEKKKIVQLRIILNKLDPIRAKNIDWQNKRRVIRAIEVAKGKHDPSPVLPRMRVLKIGLPVPCQDLFRRIDQHIDKRLRHGMIKEVQRIHGSGVPWSRLTSLGLEYREIVRTLRGQAPKSDVSTRMKTATHDFVRRQMTWWKRDKDIHWVTTAKQTEKLISEWLH